MAAVKVDWLGFAVILLSVYLPPLTDPHKAHLIETGLLPTKAVSLIELGAVLELVDP